ncbi:MAG: GNAT family N-acetyltransferase [Gemmatimonadales bacterium]|nr:MAG: GNAT family N-acetyltransferase [Gemmatimonadales bacterium]
MTSPAGPRPEVEVRPARSRDLLDLVELSREIWGTLEGWKAPELIHHQELFPEGQLVAAEPDGERVLGMAVSLILHSDVWPLTASWDELTGHGRLDTHTPGGDLLYAAGVAVHPDAQGRGIGSQLYRARERLVKTWGLRAIRAGARIPGYHRVASEVTPEAYVESVVRGERTDPTLSFQLAMGFEVLGVARNYLEIDLESMGAAAIVEWRPSPVPSQSSPS